MNDNHDFLGIGDIVTDAFIKLKEATVTCDINRENCTICMKFADKIPYEDAIVVPAVGNSSNAAVAASRLGLGSALLTNLGDDVFGKECLDALEAENVDTEFVKTNPGMKTNYHYVLWYEDERTILIKHQPYVYEFPDIRSPRWIYFSSMGEDSAGFYGRFEEYLSSHPEVKLAFQPGTYQIREREGLKYFYGRAEVVIANKEEYQKILGMPGEEDPKRLMAAMKNWGAQTALLTDGPKGAYMMTDAGAWFMPIYPDPKPPFERTGAGDAFSSTFVAALALGLPSEEAIKWGPVNSMSVVQYVGAREGLLTREKLEEFLRHAPADYNLRPLP